MQCSRALALLTWALLPASAASSFFSPSLRIPQPWHPGLARVKGPDGSLSLVRKVQEPLVQAAGEAGQRCPCPAEEATPAPKPEPGAAYMQMATGSVPRPPSLPQSNPLASARLLALKQAEAQLEQQEASIHQEVLQLRREEQLAEQAPMPFAATPPVQAWPAVPQAAPMAMPQAWPQVAQAAPMRCHSSHRPRLAGPGPGLPRCKAMLPTCQDFRWVPGASRLRRCK